MGIHRKRPMGMILSALLALTLTACVKAPPETQPPAAEATEPEILTAVRYMDTLPGNWSSTAEQTPEKEFLRSLTTAPLYHVNEDGIEPGFCALPEDVTAQFTGTYGIPTDAQRGYAFRICLEEIFWDDGRAVAAEDLRFSMETLLDEYSWLAGAREYADGWERETDRVLSLEEAGFASVGEAREAGYNRFYVDMEHFWGLEAGWSGADDRTRVQDYAMPAGLAEMYVTSGYLYERYLAEGMDYDHLQPEFVGISAEPENRMLPEDVGMITVSDRELIVVTAEPMSARSVALKLSELVLLRQELYSESYGTSPENYCSYGPYRIVSADAAVITLERNEYWTQGYEDSPAQRIECRPQ